MYTKMLKNTPCVYFISDGNGYCKIGYAADIGQRLNSMQVNNAQGLSVLHLVYDEDLDEVHRLESLYHDHLKEHKVRGEWYNEKAVMQYLNAEKEEMDALGFTQDHEKLLREESEMEKAFYEFVSTVLRPETNTGRGSEDIT